MPSVPFQKLDWNPEVKLKSGKSYFFGTIEKGVNILTGNDKLLSTAKKDNITYYLIEKEQRNELPAKKCTTSKAVKTSTKQEKVKKKSEKPEKPKKNKKVRKSKTAKKSKTKRKSKK